MEAIPTLTGPELEAEIERRPGLIPVHIDASSCEIEWLDMDRYHFYDGLFRLSLRTYLALRKTPPFRCRTALAVLETLRLDDAISPTGFIFNTGRCGSTLLVRVLARSRSNLVLSEAAPHNQIWQALPPGSRGLAMYRNLLPALGRKRLCAYDAHIVKFTSVNMVHFDFIRRAFPGVPALFVFRDPAMVIASYTRRKFWWKEWMGGGFGSWEGPEAAVEDLCNRALVASSTDQNFSCLDYTRINEEFLPRILNFFSLKPANEELQAMMSQFTWDAWSPRPTLFDRSAPGPIPPVAPSLERIYEQLLARGSKLLEL